MISFSRKETAPDLELIPFRNGKILKGPKALLHRKPRAKNRPGFLRGFGLLGETTLYRI